MVVASLGKHASENCSSQKYSHSWMSCSVVSVAAAAVDFTADMKPPSPPELPPPELSASASAASFFLAK
eukprot:CAMPEP_0206536698 /NCGR_PEP_ID=MMETSP0325_2-20121206/6906_1 /ASSEMBLY_ACC=CAM_ASM_000347 /TAXON_ID=2866 /ORGANISM="Crypthecodinium cohnii, Strain Seligo" /LENGTH=68 /DNA_ID=CAMNT_0054033963 /DNA_START=717 /DNA_END=923 /DNA_ORIENTATION=+